MKKVLVVLFIILLLSGCKKEETKTNPNVIFEDELKIISSINDKKDRELSEKLIFTEVETTLNELFQFAVFKDYDIEYGEITQGIAADGKGGRMFCAKLPVTITFTGQGDAIKKFVNYFDELKTVVSIGTFEINENEENIYEVNTVVNFIGKGLDESVSSSKNRYEITMNEVKVEEVEEITLRDFDISMTIRPVNSDAAAVTLGVTNEDGDYRIYDDENNKKEITVKFLNDGKKYYSEYSIDNTETKKASILPAANILFDILSCDIIEENDEITTDLKLINESDKKVSVMIYNDKDSRVNIIESNGNIEVGRK